MFKKITVIGFATLALGASAPSFAFGLNDILGAAAGVAKSAGASDAIVNGVDAAGAAVQAATLTDADVSAYSSQMAAQIDKQSNIAPESSAYAKRLAKIMKGWQKTDGLNLNFKVYQNKEVNAFAMGDGTVRINSGLLDMMTDDEVRFVLGHEIAHVKLGHSKAHMKAALASNATFKGAAAAGGSAARIADTQYAALAEKFLSAQFSQAHENAADAYGLKLLKAKKINPMAAVSSLEKLASLGDGGGLMSTHPSSSSRAANIRKQIGQ